MFISHTHKLLFFEVPRTGSRSITQALTRLDPRSPTAVVRAVKRNLYNYHVYEQSVVDKHPDYSLIAVHRNPYDRIRSHYKYRKQYGNPEGFKKLTFKQYLEWVCLGELPFEIGPAMIDKPICELLPFSQVNHWLAFETLNADWKTLSDTLDIKLPQLQCINSSHEEYSRGSVYDDDLANLVLKRFDSDFDQFDYNRDSWRTKV